MNKTQDKAIELFSKQLIKIGMFFDRNYETLQESPDCCLIVPQGFNDTTGTVRIPLIGNPFCSHPTLVLPKAARLRMDLGIWIARVTTSVEQGRMSYEVRMNPYYTPPSTK